MSFFNQFLYRQAAPSRHEFDLSGQVIGTHDFGIPYRPVMCCEVVPGDIWNIKLSSLVRAASMVLPTFGRCRLVNRFHYVPMNIIHDAWNEFYSGSDVSATNGSRVTPSIILLSNNTIKRYFINNATSESNYDPDAPIVSQALSYTLTDVTSTNYDFVVVDQGVSYPYRLTQRGKFVVSLLKGLGYTIDWSTSATINMSAMPLLAYAKIVYDWLMDANFVNSVDFGVQALFRLTNGSISDAQFAKLVEVFSTCYEKDYFTSAWQAPNQVDASASGIPSTNVPTLDSNPSGAGMSEITNTHIGVTLSEYHEADKFTQFGLQMMQALNSWVKKRLFTGFRVDRQVEAEFGLKLNPELARRSYYIGSVEVPISISDVMSNSTTEVSGVITHLGDYAGKGIGFNDGYLRFQPESPEFGYLICISALVPETGYVQGRKRYLFHLNRLDFFNGEFDSLGPQAIRNDELQCDFKDTTPASYSPNGIFGYAPRYAEYKCPHLIDNLLGDFLFADTNGSGDMDAFHLFRLFKGNTSVITNTYSFKTTADASQFKRIFNVPSNKFEHFNVTWNFDIKVERMMNPINDISNEIGNGEVRQMKHADDFLHG